MYVPGAAANEDARVGGECVWTSSVRRLIVRDLPHGDKNQQIICHSEATSHPFYSIFQKKRGEVLLAVAEDKIH